LTNILKDRGGKRDMTPHPGSYKAVEDSWWAGRRALKRPTHIFGRSEKKSDANHDMIARVIWRLREAEKGGTYGVEDKVFEKRQKQAAHHHKVPLLFLEESRKEVWEWGSEEAERVVYIPEKLDAKTSTSPLKTFWEERGAGKDIVALTWGFRKVAEAEARRTP
jgi:hypothetical protein